MTSKIYDLYARYLRAFSILGGLEELLSSPHSSAGFGAKPRPAGDTYDAYYFMQGLRQDFGFVGTKTDMTQQMIGKR